MGLKSFVRKAAPWAGAAAGLVISGGTPAGAMAGYNVGKGVQGAMTKKPKAGGGQPDPYSVAEGQALGDLGGYRGQYETQYQGADAESQSAIGALRQGGATYSRGYNPSNTEALNSDAFRNRSRTVGNVDTDQLTNWRNTQLEGYTPGTASYQPRDLTTGLGSGLRSEMNRVRSNGASRPTLQGAVDVSSIEGFDAGGAVREFATGAWNAASIGLRDTLKELDYEAAGRHRMKSGWFDQDKGQVVRDTATNIQAQIAQKAVEAAGITADARGRGAALRVQRAGDLDSAAIGAAGLANEQDRALLEAAGRGDELTAEGRFKEADLEYQALSDSDKLRLDAATSAGSQRLSALEAGTRAGLEKATTVDEMDLRSITEASRADRERAQFIDTSNQRRGEFLDDDTYRRESGVVDATLRRQGMAGGRAESAQDRYYDWLSGGLDRKQAAANAKAQNRNSRLQSIVGLAGTAVDAYSAWKTGRGGRAAGSGGRMVNSPVTNA